IKSRRFTAQLAPVLPNEGIAHLFTTALQDFSPPMSALGHEHPRRWARFYAGCPLRLESGQIADRIGTSALCRFCCRSPLQAFLVGDSVAVMRFATGAGDDGAAESRPGAVFLFISS